jgi:hypothetical protein
MDVRGYVEANARAFIDDLKQWLAIPSISADPDRHADVRRSAESPDGLDSDQIHAPNEQIDLSRLLRGAEASAYLWAELAAADLR